MTATMPAFMIPGSITKLEDIILTKNGKIDRKKTVEQFGGKKNG